MNRVLRALAALGAALVLAGCGNADTADDTGRPVLPDKETFRAALLAEFPDFPEEQVVDGKQEWSRGEPEAYDKRPLTADEGDVNKDTRTGDVEKGRHVSLLGWRVTSSLQTGSDGITSATGSHYRPTRLNYTGILDFAPLGVCGSGPNFDACLVPSTNGSNGRTYPVYFDDTNCGGEQVLKDAFRAGFVDAMATLQISTGWTFPAASSISQARIQVFCATGAELDLMNTTGIAGGNSTAVGMMAVTGLIEPWRVFPASFAEQLPECPQYAFESLTDSIYKYNLGEIAINWNEFFSQYDSHCLGSRDAEFIANAANTLVQHEMLHWLGFTHEFDQDNRPSFVNVMYPASGCSDGDPHPLTQLRDTRPYIVDSMNALDTSLDPPGVTSEVAEGLSCYLPLEGYGATSDSRPFDTGAHDGSSAKYAANRLYGVTYSTSTHGPCPWGSSAQCAVPGQFELPYCFLSSATNDLKTTIRTNLNLPNRAIGKFTFPERSCSDPSVKIVFRESTCGGNENSIDGIVCSGFSGQTSDNTLELNNQTPYFANANYISWTSGGGYMLVTLDRTDLNKFSTANAPFDDRSEVKTRGLLLALYNGMGVNMRTDNVNVWNSRATQPVHKNGNFSLTTPEQCMLDSFLPNSAPQFSLVSYCGNDY